MKSRAKGQSGASAVEFAIILPILVLILFGIIEMGLALYDKAMITNASREGARAGILFRVPPVTEEEIVNVVNTYLGNNLITFGDPVGATVTVTRGSFNPGDELKVSVSYTYTTLVLPRLLTDFGPAFGMVAETTMRME
jgi:Flp pilus assembly protein TadG